MTETILIVDDSRFHRTLAADLLQRAGYHTAELEEGTQAWDALADSSPTLLIMDWLMPGLDGLEVCRRLKSDPFKRHIPILMLATGEGTPDRVDALRSGADRYLARPSAPEKILAEVDLLLSQRFQYDSLTRLPAGPRLHLEIDHRLAAGEKVGIVFVDIDRFRVYNYIYGHPNGDRVLLCLTDLIRSSLPKLEGEFVGHLGGDDFVVLLEPSRADEFCARLSAAFIATRPQWYPTEDLERGSMQIQDPRGRPVQWELVNVTMAIVTNEKRNLTNYFQVSDLLTSLMRYAKSQSGDRWVRDRRAR